MNAFARPNLSRLQTKQYAIRLALDAQIIIKMKRSDADLHLMTESLCDRWHDKEVYHHSARGARGYCPQPSSFGATTILASTQPQGGRSR
mmetsp:Transcript_17320/g.40280  ORF Transcript_17320/g.40280 Transcript_17320/m.40280 type:complete len:90 (-) Transcript_17320:49-318(-)